MHSMVDIAPSVSAVLGLPPPAQARGTPILEMVADLEGSKRVAILVPDGLGLHAWRLWAAEMPYLGALHQNRSITLHSVMPSITPVNFATMVTGTDRAGHGIAAFSDDFACETLFDVVRRSDGRSAGVGLEGYTGTRLLGRVADICGNAGDGSDDDVADSVIEIAEGERPVFVIAQLGRVDDVFHRYGPSADSVVPMLRETDARLRRLGGRLKPLGYAILILADHGHHDVTDASEGGLRGNHGTGSPEDCLVPCTWA